MFKPLHLRVLTPAKTLVDVEDVAWVRVRLVDGRGISIYPGHARLLGETQPASLQYADSSGEHSLDLAAGILQVEDGDVFIFTSGRGFGPKPPSSEEGARYDRLAKELLRRLEVEPKGVLDSDAEA
jgi:F0F1-type ATP synthase epsilon subunit